MIHPNNKRVFYQYAEILLKQVLISTLGDVHETFSTTNLYLTYLLIYLFAFRCIVMLSRIFSRTQI